MNDLLLNPQTSAQLKIVVENTPHAVLLSGNASSGKRTVAINIAQQILKQKLENYPYFMHLKPDKNTLTINQIRELKDFLKLKTTGKKIIRRIVILEDAHLMNTEAQNALLKILEEPPEDTMIVLTVVGHQTLKPTIYSRSQQISIRPIDKKNAKEYAKSINKASLFEKSYALSQGDAGLYVALLENDGSHPLAAAILSAKQLIMYDYYKRLIQLDTITKDKDSMAMLIFALKRVVAAALNNAVIKNDISLQNRWLEALNEIIFTEDKIRKNSNSKLLLTDLFFVL